jgi:hypothetical protein
MQYMKEDAVVFDMFASRDGENLAWLRSPYVKDKRILLLKGENVDVQSSFPCKTVESLTLNDVENFDIIISASPLHLNPDQEFYNAARLTDLLYKRLHYKRLVYLIVREAANLLLEAQSFRQSGCSKSKHDLHDKRSAACWPCPRP